MDALLDALAKLLGTFKDTTQIVLLLMCIAEGYFIYVMRKENREDIGKMTEALKANAEALNGVKLAIAAMTGKV